VALQLSPPLCHFFFLCVCVRARGDKSDFDHRKDGMAHSSGLMALMDAERQAQDIVATARQQKTIMVKKARDEAQEEVRRFREEREEQYRKYVQQFKGATEEYCARLRGVTEKQVADLRATAEAKGDEVVRLLVDAVVTVDFDV